MGNILYKTSLEKTFKPKPLRELVLNKINQSWFGSGKIEKLEQRVEAQSEIIARLLSCLYDSDKLRISDLRSILDESEETLERHEED